MDFRVFKVWALLLATCSLATTGCLRVAPKMPGVVSSPPDIYYSAADLKTDVDTYRASLKAAKLDDAKTERDQLVYRVLAQLDAGYGQFEITLTTSRAGYQTAGAAVNLGLTAAATVAGVADIKTILAATSNAYISGVKSAVDVYRL
jgi:outer membrane murein-binding lipoprotein Lpp